MLNRAVIKVSLGLWALAGSAWAVETISPLPEITGRPQPEDYQQWLKANPEAAVRLTKFESYLQSKNVADVLPMDQIIRSASEWKRCDYSAFDIAPEADWPHIVLTLAFIRDHVVPAVGPVEVVSGYRAPAFNTCVGGASQSAHRDFWALDLIPVDRSISRKDLISKICAAHRQYGEAYRTGLGFYSGVRFHIDSKAYRRWGADRHGASSPCD